MNVMSNYKERLEYLIEDLNILCLDRTLTQEKKNTGEFKLYERDIIRSTPSEYVIGNIHIGIEYREFKEYDRSLPEGKYLFMRFDFRYNDEITKEYATEHLYKKVYYEFLKYTLFAKEFNSKDSNGIGIRIIPIRDLIVYGLNER